MTQIFESNLHNSHSTSQYHLPAGLQQLCMPLSSLGVWLAQKRQTKQNTPGADRVLVQLRACTSSDSLSGWSYSSLASWKAVDKSAAGCCGSSSGLDVLRPVCPQLGARKKHIVNVAEQAVTNGVLFVSSSRSVCLGLHLSPAWHGGRHTATPGGATGCHLAPCGPAPVPVRLCNSEQHLA